MYLAVQEGHFDIVEALLQKDRYLQQLNPNEAPKETGLTALHVAVLNGDDRIVKALLNGNFKTKINPNSTRLCDSVTPIYFAAQNGHFDVVKTLLKAGADANLENYGCTPIMATTNEKIKNLLKKDKKLKSNI